MVRNDMVRDVTVNGKDNGNVTEFDWRLEDGTLTVEGNGRMPDLNRNNHAASLWQDIKESIRKVKIGEGITEIGSRNFEGCTNLREITLPDAKTSIYEYAFKGCTNLQSFDFQNIKNARMYTVQNCQKESPCCS